MSGNEEHPAITEMFKQLQAFEEAHAPKPDDVVLLICHSRSLDKLRTMTSTPYLSLNNGSMFGLQIETDDWHSTDHWTAVLHKQKAAYDRCRQQHRPVKAIYLAAQDVPAGTTL